MTTRAIRTHAEAQTILDFVERVLNDANAHHGTIGYSIQIELDILARETGVEQVFNRILAGRLDEGMPCCDDD